MSDEWGMRCRPGSIWKGGWTVKLTSAPALHLLITGPSYRFSCRRDRSLPALGSFRKSSRRDQSTITSSGSVKEIHLGVVTYQRIGRKIIMAMLALTEREYRRSPGFLLNNVTFLPMQTSQAGWTSVGETLLLIDTNKCRIILKCGLRYS